MRRAYTDPESYPFGKGRSVPMWMFVGCGIWLTGLGLYFIVLRPPLLPEDPRFMGTTLKQIRTAVPGIERRLPVVTVVSVE